MTREKPDDTEGKVGVPASPEVRGADESPTASEAGGFAGAGGEGKEAKAEAGIKSANKAQINETASSQRAAESPNEPPVGPPPEPGTTPENTKCPDRLHDNKPKEPEWPRRHSLWTLLFNGILAVSAIVGAWYISDQLALTRQSNAMTKAALDFSIEQDHATAHEAVESRKLALKQAEAAVAAAKASEESIKAVRESLRLEQRAWLGISGPVVPFNVVLGPPWYILRFDLPLQNFGRSPALRVVSWAVMSAGTKEIERAQAQACELTDRYFDFADPGIRKASEETGAYSRAIFPGHEIQAAIQVNVETKSVPTNQMVYLLGCIAYEDVFRQRRQTKFCYNSPTTAMNVNTNTRFRQCWFGNDVK